MPTLYIDSGSFNDLQVTGSTILSGSVNVSGSLLVNGVPVLSSTNFNNFTSSYNTGSFTGSFIGSLQGIATTASFVLSSSYALTASYLNTLNQDLTFNGNLILNGTASITYLNVFYESSSVIYSSGSNQFGDATNDTQTLIGRTIVSGSFEVTGSIISTLGFTGSLFGTASQATTASLALTASYAVSTGEIGIATLDYGSPPGTNTATVVINTPNVSNNSSINIYIMNTSSINHNTADHQVFSLYSRVMPGNIINNTSFDITCISDLRINGQFKVKYNIIN